MPDPLVRVLISHFDGVFEGPNGDYPAVLDSLAGVTALVASWRPGPEQNSIWRLVDHLTATKLWQVEVLENGQAASPAWTEPAGDDGAWQESLAKLKEAHALLVTALGRLSDEALLRVPNPEWQQTQLELLISIAAHEAHHSGQIDYLKGWQARL